MLFSIGYDSYSLHTFLEALKQNQIEILVDVRTHPFSRLDRFCREPLRITLKENGIQYLWWGNRLGGKSGVRQPLYDKALLELNNLAKAKNVCVMCMEADPTKCHRDLWIARDLWNRFNFDCKHITLRTLKFGRQTQFK